MGSILALVSSMFGFVGNLFQGFTQEQLAQIDLQKQREYINFLNWQSTHTEQGQQVNLMKMAFIIVLIIIIVVAIVVILKAKKQ